MDYQDDWFGARMNDLIASAKPDSESEPLETYHFLHVLTPLLSKLREPKGGIHDSPHFFGRIPPRVTDTPSIYPVYHDVPQYYSYVLSHPTSTS